jgi:cytidylate kinase
VGTASPSDPPDSPDAAGVVLELASSRSPTLGAARLLCVEGPAGSGKTTLGRELARRTGAQLIQGDDLMSGWRGLDSVGRQLTAVVEALAAGRPASYEHFDWAADRYDRSVEVPAAPWLVVEGVGSGAASLAAYTTVLVWVEVDDDLRLARGLERDGAAMEQHWRRFMLDERELFDRDRSRERADVLVDGTGARAPVLR